MWRVDKSCVKGICEKAYHRFYDNDEKIGYSSRSFLLLSLFALIGLNTAEMYVECVKHLMELKTEIHRVWQFIILVNK